MASQDQFANLPEQIAAALDGISAKKRNTSQFISGPKKGKERKRKDVIRDDGVVFPFSKALMLDPRFRLYTGPLPCSVHEGLAWLYGEGMAAPAIDDDVQAFNVNTASKPELLRFAKEKFGKVLSGLWDVDRVRQEVTEMLAAAAENEAEAEQYLQDGQDAQDDEPAQVAAPVTERDYSQPPRRRGRPAAPKPIDYPPPVQAVQMAEQTIANGGEV